MDPRRHSRRASLGLALVAGLTAGGCATAETTGTPWETATVRGVDFRAVGQEPGWVLEIDRGRQIEYRGDYGQTRIVTPAPEPSRDATGALTYEAATEAHRLTLVIREEPCSDTMSGERFAYRATLTVDGTRLEGCGSALGTPALTGTRWRLVELGGTAAVAGLPGREPHLLLPPGEVRATGSTGCNSFGGAYEIAGERLSFGELVSTRMACTDPALSRQEREFLAALDATDRFTLQGDTLTLYAGERLLARLAGD